VPARARLGMVTLPRGGKRPQAPALTGAPRLGHLVAGERSNFRGGCTALCDRKAASKTEFRHRSRALVSQQAMVLTAPWPCPLSS
jgi:hypothetical protein